MIVRACHEKRPQMRAFEEGVGPEFEGSTHSGCHRHRRPLQHSRLPTTLILVEQLNGCPSNFVGRLGEGGGCGCLTVT